MSHAPAQFQLDAPPFAASVLRGRLVITKSTGIKG